MKQQILHIIYVLLAVVCCLLPEESRAEGIRIVPKQFIVRNDSLRLDIEMDLNEVRVGRGTAVIFTPMLEGMQRQLLPLPPVVISGNRRARQDRREYYLSPEKAISPYILIRYNRTRPSKNVRYQVAVPYQAWMRQAVLLLKQESKECCDAEVLAVDTLQRSLAIKNAPESTPNTIIYTQAELKRIHPAASLPKVTWSRSDLNQYISMVSFLTPDAEEGGKHRSENAVLYIDYPINRDEIYPDFKNNRRELEKIDNILSPLLKNNFSTMERIQIRGYSSPDGPYADNERLAKSRSYHFSSYIRNTYHIPAGLTDQSSVAEDWEGFINLLREGNPPYREAALDIIRRYGIFDGRERQLMELQGGVPYRDMMNRYFPKLRRIEVIVRYNVRKIANNEAVNLIYTHPELLSLEEMYGVARYYRPGTDQYREVYEIAAFHFPDDVVANVNAASAVMLTGDLQSASDYLKKVDSDPRAWNNMGVLCLMEGDAKAAAAWFRKAVGVEPQKARMNLQLTGEN